MTSTEPHTVALAILDEDGAPTVVNVADTPAVPMSRSASKGAHSRSCAGSVSACQTRCGA